MQWSLMTLVGDATSNQCSNKTPLPAWDPGHSPIQVFLHRWIDHTTVMPTSCALRVVRLTEDFQTLRGDPKRKGSRWWRPRNPWYVDLAMDCRTGDVHRSRTEESLSPAAAWNASGRRGAMSRGAVPPHSLRDPDLCEGLRRERLSVEASLGTLAGFETRPEIFLNHVCNASVVNCGGRTESYCQHDVRRALQRAARR